ncbi:hypothetical protein DYB32_002377 [Aphanomyces invadans]|uniref:C2 domain-containing protein n=1 Tax=Aphanomyces invadans TaxID=157072 RepID=A0A3R6YD11_9STRA|nr:hypothetical protein DYB32_002377 [Aphanomyces invadans]
MSADSSDNLRFVRVQLHHVLGVEPIIASTCLGGVRRSSIFAELRLFGDGASHTPMYQSNSIPAHGGRWYNDIMDLHLTEQDMYTRVLGITLYAVDLLGLSVCIGEAKVPMTPYELLKHQITITDDINLTEETFDSTCEEVKTGRLRVSVAVWTKDDMLHSTTLEVWEHQRYAWGSWSSSHLLATDRPTYSCGSITSNKWVDIEPDVPQDYIEVLGWSADKTQGDDSGWFYAASFSGPWHNVAGHAFSCRRRRLTKRALLASAQSQKHVQHELLRLDHPQLVREFQDVQLLAKVQKLAQAHREELAIARENHTNAMLTARTIFEEKLATAKGIQKDLSDQVAALQSQVAAMESKLDMHSLSATPDSTDGSMSMSSLHATAPWLFRVQLHNAKNLVAADSVFMGGKSDPYVVFTIGSIQRKSTMQRITLDPVWYNEIYDFDLTRGTCATAVLDVQVFDFDKFSADELIGSVQIPLSELEETYDPDTPQTFPLEIPKTFGRKASTVTLQFEFGSWYDDDDDDMDLWPKTAPVQLVMWENERHARGKWSAHNLKSFDRKAWTVGDMASSAREEIAPKIPLGFESHLGWAVDRNHGDANGWFYASSFDGPWMNGPHATSVVRRRKWTQRCTRRRKRCEMLSMPEDDLLLLHATVA